MRYRERYSGLRHTFHLDSRNEEQHNHSRHHHKYNCYHSYDDDDDDDNNNKSACRLLRGYEGLQTGHCASCHVDQRRRRDVSQWIIHRPCNRCILVRKVSIHSIDCGKTIVVVPYYPVVISSSQSGARLILIPIPHQFPTLASI